MTWQKFRRIDTYVSKNDPIISMSKDRFNFNSLFVRMAKVTPDHKVLIHVDPPSFRVGFEFVTKDEPDALGVRPMTSGRTGGGMSCAARGLGSQFPWVAKVGVLPDKKDRQFNPKQERNLWVIQLCPAFEISADKSGADIPSDAEGIYRYVNSKNEVVYIGRGKIRTRLNSPEREQWDFDKVEFSIVENQDDRERWEAYWIERFKETHGGCLPYHNAVSGTSASSDGQQEAGGGKK